MLTGSLKEGKPVELKAGQTYQIVIDSAIEGDATRVSTNYRELPETVQLGSKILIDNGGLECEVTEVAEVSTSQFDQSNITQEHLCALLANRTE